MRLAIIAGLAAASTVVASAHDLQQVLPRDVLDHRDTPVEIPLEIFQVEAPVRASFDNPACSQVIVQSDFTASYGSPFVGTYTPPADCNFTTVVLNMTVTSAGINYDRLTLLYLGDVEVWRHTTAMPVRTGIFYTFSKDVTAYTALLRAEQKVILQLDNIYNSVFTGNFNVTITALYYNDNDNDDGTSTSAINPPDVILPISSLSSPENKTSVFSLPTDNATTALTIPRNAARAVVSIFASGNGNEEFWYGDAPAEFLSTFGPDVTFANGYGPWREVQVLVDGALAGVVWPETIVFTGGVSTGLWVPVVGIDAYDLGSVDVDVSPWLGVLCDGGAHEFEIRVVGFNSSAPGSLGTVAQNWYVSGLVSVWLDEGGNQTTGTVVSSVVDDPVFSLASSLTTFSNGSNSSLHISLCASRGLLSHSSVITTSKGSRNLTWQQDLSYLNVQNVTARGRNNTLYNGVWPTTRSSAVDDGQASALDTFSVSRVLSFFQAYAPAADYVATNSSIYALLDNGKQTTGRRVLDSLVYPASSTGNSSTAIAATAPSYELTTRQNGTSLYFWNNTYYESAGAIDPARGSDGATEQWFSSSAGTLLYGRHALAIDGYEPVLVEDEIVVGSTLPVPEPSAVAGEGVDVLVAPGGQALVGFGPFACGSSD